MIQDGVDERPRCPDPLARRPRRANRRRSLITNGRTTRNRGEKIPLGISAILAPRRNVTPSRISAWGSRLIGQGTLRRFDLLLVPLRSFLLSLFSSSFFSSSICRRRAALSRLLPSIRTARQLKIRSSRAAYLRFRSRWTSSQSQSPCVPRTDARLSFSLSLSLPTVMARLKSI